MNLIYFQKTASKSVPLFSKFSLLFPIDEFTRNKYIIQQINGHLKLEILAEIYDKMTNAEKYRSTADMWIY